jgi:hypothetical protein
MPYTMDPYTLLFIIPISVLFTLTIIVYLLFQSSKFNDETKTSEKKGARWQTPRIVKVKQSNSNHTQVTECMLLVIRNIGDTAAMGVRVWATAEEKELKIRKTRRLSFPPVNAKETGISVHPIHAAEFVISSLNPDQDFWIQWKEDGTLKSRLLNRADRTILGIWTRDSASE